MPGAKPNDIQKVVAERLREIRKRIGSQQDLVNRLTELGVKPGGLADRATIARIELGERRVAVHELYLLAAALGVSPLSLLTPTRKTKLKIAPQLTRDSSAIERWLFYLQPLEESDEHIFFSESTFGEKPEVRPGDEDTIRAFKDMARLLAQGQEQMERMERVLEALGLRADKLKSTMEEK